eukprot:Gb_23198 [translate_table: standard]
MSVKDGGQKSAVSRESAMKVSNLGRKPTKSIAGKSTYGSLFSEKKPPGKASSGHSLDDLRSAKQILCAGAKTGAQLRSFNGEPKFQTAKNSTGLGSRISLRTSCDFSKDGHSYLRLSTGSCHDACKFGTHWSFEDSNASKSGGKNSAKKVSKIGVTKPSSTSSSSSSKPSGTRVSKISVIKSPVRSRISDAARAVKSALKTPGRKPISVNSRIQSDAKFVKPSKSSSTPEGRFKVARSLFRSPKGATDGSDHAVPNKILGSKMTTHMPRQMPKDSTSIKCQASRPIQSVMLSDAAGSPDGVLIKQAFGREPDINCQICDDKSEDEFFREFFPHAGEPDAAFMKQNDGHWDKISSMECHQRSDHKNNVFEAFYAGNLVNHPDLDSPFYYGDQCYNSEYSESDLKSEGCEEDYDNIGKRHVNMNNNILSFSDQKRRFRRGRGIDHVGDLNPEPENVVLRHQDLQGRKPSEEWMIDHAIGEAVNKLSHYEESKVKLLVGAFETVISLTDQAENSEMKHDAEKDLPHIRPLQACN